MREPPFEHPPEVRPKSLAELVAIANAIEHEAVRRYATLAQSMSLRGEAATAAALRVMLDEERKHVEAVGHWASALGQPLPADGKPGPGAPVNLWQALDEAAGSARLTPYRAFAIAADSERKAFALYSYIAAEAADPKIREQAERLALEELSHASLMRRFRRQAWHRERRERDEAPVVVASAVALHALLGRNEAAIAARHRAIAARLRELGDDEDAALLERLLQAPSWPAAAPAPHGVVIKLPEGDTVALLVSAQEAHEAFCETLEGVLRTTEGELFAEVEKALANVVTRIAQLSLHTARRLQAAQS